MLSDEMEISISGNRLKIARLTEERYIDIENPETLLNSIKTKNLKADLFTFAQRLPESRPKFNYHLTFDTCAALPIQTYDYWLKNQIPKQTRTSIKKAYKEGVVVRQADFDDDFIHGMVEIFNECPIRQGKPSWPYGKAFNAVKQEFSKYAFREDHIGAYYKDELIGFIFLAYAGRYAITIQIIAKIKHQDKKPTNALLAKAVEICAEKKIPYLVYGRWARGTWGDFKKHNGFENILLPRYYIPLTLKGSIALKLLLQDGIVGILPEKLILRLRDIRKKFYTKKFDIE